MTIQTKPDQSVSAPIIVRAAETRPASYREEDNSIEVCWSTGARVLRFDWWDGEYYYEELSLEAGSVRLERLNAGAPVLDTHSSYRLANVIGAVIPGSAKVSGDEATARIRLAETDDVADSVAKIKAGIVRNISVGYAVHSFIRIENEGEKPIMRATDWEPMELSFVPINADAEAQVRSRNAEQGGHPCIIRGIPEDKEEIDMTERSPTPAPAPAPSPVPAPAPAPAPVNEERTTPSGINATRISDICARSDVGDAFALTLIKRNDETPMTDADLTDSIAAELERKRAKPIVSARVGAAATEGEGYCRAVETAVLLRANPGMKIEDAQAIEDAREFRGMSLMEMARHYLGGIGMRVAGMGKLEIAGAALGLRGGQLTTSDFANALSSAVSKRVRSAYEAAPQTFKPFISMGTLPDFKDTNIIGLGDAPQLLLVKENAEFTYGAIADTGMSYRLSTYGRIIAITRQALINDDKSLFSRVPTMFGRKAADLESDLVYGILTSNPTMADGVALFHATHGNLAGSGGAINVGTVSAGEQAMMQQTSVEGGFINVRPAYLIVGPAKKIEAEQFLTAVMATQTSNVNPYPGTLQLIVDPRITGNQWFLAADPAAFDTIELAHLDGQEALYIETQPGFDVDGIKTKARLDVGGAPIDHRGLYKNAGN